MMSNVSQRYITVFMVLLVNLSAQAADPLKPHPHQGIVTPFEGSPPRVTLSEEEEARLGQGEAVLTTLEEKSGGRGTAVRDVNAPPEVVWDRIGAFDQYPDMVPRMAESEVYYRNGNDLRVRMVIRVMGLRYEYFIRHDYQPEKGFVTWTLDYDKLSDLDESVGYWAVLPHPSEPGQSRVFYSIDMKTRGWMPGFVRRMVARQGLEEATGWVKTESEKAP
jgi:ribosome-associated toxin RatA of RatAB toxin-antitoxin module